MLCCWGLRGRHLLSLSLCLRERFIRSIQPAWLMETGLCSCLSLLQQGNEAMADRLLVLVPHEHTHAPRSILEQARKMGPDVTEMRAIKHTMELMAHSMCIAGQERGLSTPCTSASPQYFWRSQYAEFSAANGNFHRRQSFQAFRCKTLSKRATTRPLCATRPELREMIGKRTDLPWICRRLLGARG